MASQPVLMPVVTGSNVLGLIFDQQAIIECFVTLNVASLFYSSTEPLKDIVICFKNSVKIPAGIFFICLNFVIIFVYMF